MLRGTIMILQEIQRTPRIVVATVARPWVLQRQSSSAPRSGDRGYMCCSNLFRIIAWSCKIDRIHLIQDR
ncbi:MAG: hypothetical protein JWN70_6511 [Planctomycetaceae bacterium]|nr:hypothetical protein [Planctomycetaceae bacterium]